MGETTDAMNYIEPTLERAPHVPRDANRDPRARQVPVGEERDGPAGASVAGRKVKDNVCRGRGHADAEREEQQENTRRNWNNRPSH